MASANASIIIDHCIKLDVVTPERLVFSDTVNYVTAPGIEGELGILPYHCSLITILKPGELRIIKNGKEIYVAIGGGFLEVRPDRVIILADVAERDDEIDAQKVEESIRRAKRVLSGGQISIIDKSEAEAALQRELARLKIVDRKKKRKASGLTNHSL